MVSHPAKFIFCNNNVDVKCMADISTEPMAWQMF